MAGGSPSMAELLEFRVPAGRDRTLLVWGLEPEPGLEVRRSLGLGLGSGAQDPRPGPGNGDRDPPGWGAGTWISTIPLWS